MVRTIATGNAFEIREVYENRRSRGCQGMLVPPHVQLGYQACSCVEGERGQRTLRCLECGTVHYEPEHQGCETPGDGSRPVQGSAAVLSEGESTHHPRRAPIGPEGGPEPGLARGPGELLVPNNPRSVCAARGGLA